MKKSVERALIKEYKDLGEFEKSHEFKVQMMMGKIDVATHLSIKKSELLEKLRDCSQVGLKALD